MSKLRNLVPGTLIALLCLLLSFPPPAKASPLRAPASNGSCVAYERGALLSIKESLWEPNVNLSSWQGEECCNWKGVRCSYKTGHVVKLNLRGSAQDCLRYSTYRETRHEAEKKDRKLLSGSWLHQREEKASIACRDVKATLGVLSVVRVGPGRRHDMAPSARCV